MQHPQSPARPHIYAVLLFAIAGCGRDGFGVFSSRDTLGEQPNGDTDTEVPANDGLDLGPISVTNLLPESAQWNAYVRDHGGSLLTLTSTSCVTADATYRACRHAGEVQKVDVAKASTCDGLTLRDSLDAFDWECVVHDGSVTFVSRSLRPDKGLRDLIDFEALTWNPLSVTLTSQTGTWTSDAVVLWSTPVVLPSQSNGTHYDVRQSESVTVITSAAQTGSFTLDIAGAALVTAPGVTLDAPGGEACELFSIADQGFYGGSCVVAVAQTERAWIEVTLGARPADGTSSSGGVVLTQAPWSRVHATTVGEGFEVPLQADNATGLRITGATISRGSALVLQDVLGSLVSDVRLGGLGLHLSGSNDNVVTRLIAYGAQSGIEVRGGSSNNTFTDIVSFGHHDHAFKTSENATANSLTAFTVASVDGQVVALWPVSTTTALHLGAVTNGSQPGVALNGNNTSVSDLISAGGSQGPLVVDQSSSYNKFSGHITFDVDATEGCWQNYSTVDPGIDSDCAPQGLSDFVLDAPVARLTDAFVGPVAEDAASGNTTTSGVATFAGRDTGFDYVGASLRYRGWTSSGSFLTEEQQNCPAWDDTTGCFSGAASLALVDFSLRADDTVLRNRALPNVTFTDGVACPAGLDGSNVVHDVQGGEVLGDGIGNDDGECNVGEACAGNVFIRPAIELIDDGYGDDDGLCESNERCVFAPNYGAYQGHGDTAPHRCIFADGEVSGVTMFAYPENGY